MKRFTSGTKLPGNSQLEVRVFILTIDVRSKNMASAGSPRNSAFIREQVNLNSFRYGVFSFQHQITTLQLDKLTFVPTIPRHN
jgi:hypothetical protein